MHASPTVLLALALAIAAAAPAAASSKQPAKERYVVIDGQVGDMQFHIPPDTPINERIATIESHLGKGRYSFQFFDSQPSLQAANSNAPTPVALSPMLTTKSNNAGGFAILNSYGPPVTNSNNAGDFFFRDNHGSPIMQTGPWTPTFSSHMPPATTNLNSFGGFPELYGDGPPNVPTGPVALNSHTHLSKTGYMYSSTDRANNPWGHALTDDDPSKDTKVPLRGSRGMMDSADSAESETKLPFRRLSGSHFKPSHESSKTSTASKTSIASRISSSSSTSSKGTNEESSVSDHGWNVQSRSSSGRLFSPPFLTSLVNNGRQRNYDQQQPVISRTNDALSNSGETPSVGSDYGPIRSPTYIPPLNRETRQRNYHPQQSTVSEAYTFSGSTLPESGEKSSVGSSYGPNVQSRSPPRERPVLSYSSTYEPYLKVPRQRNHDQQQSTVSEANTFSGSALPESSEKSSVGSGYGTDAQPRSPPRKLFISPSLTSSLNNVVQQPVRTPQQTTVSVTNVSSRSALPKSGENPFGKSDYDTDAQPRSSPGGLFSSPSLASSVNNGRQRHYDQQQPMVSGTYIFTGSALSTSSKNPSGRSDQSSSVQSRMPSGGLFSPPSSASPVAKETQQPVRAPQQSTISGTSASPRSALPGSGESPSGRSGYGPDAQSRPLPRGSPSAYQSSGPSVKAQESQSQAEKKKRKPSERQIAFGCSEKDCRDAAKVIKGWFS